MSDESTSSTSPAPPPSGTEVSRRNFLTLFSLGMGAAGTVLVGAPLSGFVLAPLFEKTAPAWRDVGEAARFAVGSTTKVVFEDPSPLPWAGISARTAAWLRRESEDEWIAFSVNCAHLGCPVRWLESANLFMCPCHGGVYYRNGDVAAGPPPHGLARYPVRVQEGKVQIETAPLPVTTAGPQIGQRRCDRGRLA